MTLSEKIIELLRSEYLLLSPSEIEAAVQAAMVVIRKDFDK